ncbi:Transposable element Tcb2 transposase [Cucumispora dikerogammari]|nr:Transposable element Tcb2 transposase [Cucumispora dikerogammari]
MGWYAYVNILSFKLFDSAKKFSLFSFKFQHDNDFKHTSVYTKEYMLRNNIIVLYWPSQSLNLNSIRNLWAFIKQKLQGKNFSKKKDLIAYVFDLWKNIPTDLCEKLVKSMFNRTNQVLQSDGSYTGF